MAKNKQVRIWLFAAGVILLIISLVQPAFQKSAEPTNTMNVTPKTFTNEWQNAYYKTATANLQNYDSFTANTEYYDYDNQVISDVAAKIAKESDNADMAIAKTLEYVYANVAYTNAESSDTCMASTAPAILASKKGQCDTQSIVVISILRKMGIAAAPVGGCLSSNPYCAIRMEQAAYTGPFGETILNPKYTPLTPEAETLTEVGRGATPRAGGLHAYAMAWENTGKWKVLESTTGEFADVSCYYYHVELFPANEDKKQICVSTNKNYVQACRLDQIPKMDEQGIGLATEVTPTGDAKNPITTNIFTILAVLLIISSLVMGYGGQSK